MKRLFCLWLLQFQLDSQMHTTSSSSSYDFVQPTVLFITVLFICFIYNIYLYVVSSTNGSFSLYTSISLAHVLSCVTNEPLCCKPNVNKEKFGIKGTSLAVTDWRGSFSPAHIPGLWKLPSFTVRHKLVLVHQEGKYQMTRPWCYFRTLFAFTVSSLETLVMAVF